MMRSHFMQLEEANNVTVMIADSGQRNCYDNVTVSIMEGAIL